MKSSSQQLIDRGFISETTTLPTITLNEALLELTGEAPIKRSVAARIIGEQFLFEAGAAEALLKQLRKEKKLYTRLEICRALEKGNVSVAEMLLGYLGTIGSNQYRTLAEAKTSKKKSYPLARDIVARIFGNMAEAIVPVLLKSLENEMWALEGIDALGFLIFYHPTQQTKANFKAGAAAYRRFEDNPVFIWKFITFCSAFPYEYSKEILEELGQQHTEKIFQQELTRTRRLTSV